MSVCVFGLDQKLVNSYTTGSLDNSFSHGIYRTYHKYHTITKKVYYKECNIVPFQLA